jgi:hypothetical protein
MRADIFNHHSSWSVETLDAVVREIERRCLASQPAMMEPEIQGR